MASYVDRYLQDRAEGEEKQSPLAFLEGQIGRKKTGQKEGATRELRESNSEIRERERRKQQGSDLSWAGIASKKKGGVEKNSLRIEWENSAQEGWLVTVWKRNSMLKLFDNRSIFHISTFPSTLY